MCFRVSGSIVQRYILHTCGPNKSFKMRTLLSMRISCSPIQCAHVCVCVCQSRRYIQPHLLSFGLSVKLKTFQFPYRFLHVDILVVTRSHLARSTSINLWNRVYSVTTAATAAYLPNSRRPVPILDRQANTLKLLADGFVVPLPHAPHTIPQHSVQFT